MQILRLILPIYFILYLGLAFVAKSILIARRIGKNPIVWTGDDLYGRIGRYFKLTLLMIFIYIIIFALLPAWYDAFLPIKQMHNGVFMYIGLGLLAGSLIWTIIAQNHMRDSWRIGIDTKTKTQLITTGLYNISRNPIYFGLVSTLVGLFLVTPNALTIVFLIVGYVLIQRQIRLEETFLTQEHGQFYLDYKKKVRRLI